MRNKIIYIAAFTAAFLLVTGGTIYFNSMYRNIFHFNFTPEKPKAGKLIPKFPDSLKVADIKYYFQNEFKHEFFDSLKSLITSKNTDTVYAKPEKDNTLIDSLKQLEVALKKSDAALKKQSNITTADTNRAKSDSVYNVWIQKTSKLFESMDSGSAAKIIQSYSDNVARDIIYAMRQKKAADILSQLSPETANRITRAK